MNVHTWLSDLHDAYTLATNLLKRVSNQWVQRGDIERRGKMGQKQPKEEG
ncbi:MAG: hypothetical protein QNL24_14360 [Akkermansiaceae bacterium]|jgi:hypothetical protein